MTPLERAAQPIAKALNSAFVVGFTASDSDEGWESCMDEAKDLARAVLQAIREPSEGMKGRAEFTDLEHSYGGDTHSFDYLSADGACEVWQKMIDAALEEG